MKSIVILFLTSLVAISIGQQQSFDNPDIEYEGNEGLFWLIFSMKYKNFKSINSFSHSWSFHTDKMS